MKRFALRAFLGDQTGTILILTGLGFLFLVAIGGAAYDLGRQQLVRQRIQQASDAAALAGAGREQLASDADRISTANAIFSLNYPATYFGIARPTPSIRIDSGASITVGATRTVPTSFVGNLGIATLQAKGSSTAQIRKYTQKLDLIMVLDNSGSMASTDVGSGNSLNGGPSTHLNCLDGWTAYGYGLVPFPPPTPTYCNNNISCCATFEGVTGFTRLNALRYSATQLTDTLMNPNPLNHRIALVTWDNLLMGTQDFSANPSPVKTFLINMYGRGATNSKAGLLQAYTMASAPTGFRADTIHVVILMTDGRNGSSASTPADRAAINTASLEVCKQLKSMPQTLLFTIGFGNEVLTDSTAQQFLSDCATGPNGSGSPKPNENIYYYPAADAAALNAAFTNIVGTLKNVRILQ